MAKKAKKKLSKSYMMGMRRPTKNYELSYYQKSPDYFYRGKLNAHCDIWYSTQYQEEIMRCEPGYYYNYDREFPESPNYDKNYKSWNSQPNDWNRQAEYRKIDD